jgi:hypothetical protein
MNFTRQKIVRGYLLNFFVEDDALLCLNTEQTSTVGQSDEETEELSKITLENKDIQLDINIRGEELFNLLVNVFLL